MTNNSAVNTKNSIPFEIHLTVSNLSNNKIDDFIGLCHRFNGNPLLIQLAQGEFSQQPMFTKSFIAENIESVLENAEKLVNKFQSENYQIGRIKLEIDAKYAKLFRKTGENYFEWHGKISIENLNTVLKLCDKHNVHLSKNSLKDEQLFRFLTLRDFQSIESYQNKLIELKEDIRQESIEIIKEVSEFCVYDNNQILDKGWLPK